MKLLESASCVGSGTFDPGKICNLACVTCGPSASTRWQKELKMAITPGNPAEIDQDSIAKANRMKHLVVGGGEPVLNASTKTLLSSLDVDVGLSIHFNGTVVPDQEFLHLSARFSDIRYVFSLDGVGQRFEYLRWPGKWDRVASNIVQLVHLAPDCVQFGVNTTISQLNRHYHTEVVDWVSLAIPHNRQGKSTHVSYNHAGDTLLSRDYLDKLDAKRNTQWRQLFPLAVQDVH